MISRTYPMLFSLTVTSTIVAGTTAYPPIPGEECYANELKSQRSTLPQSTFTICHLGSKDVAL